MWDAQGYGNQGAGGFFNSPSQGPSSTEKQAKPARRVQNLVPLTVRTVLGATDAGLHFGGEEVHMFTVVGLVRKVEVTSTKITYLIDDGTGGISALFWIESSDGEEDQTIPPVMEDTYCRVFGSLRMQQGKPYIFVFRIVPLENLNELTRHLLEVIHAKLKMEKIESKEQQVAPVNVSRPNAANELSNSMMETGIGQLPNFTPQQTMVYNVIRQSTMDIGTGKDELVKVLSGKISPKQIDMILDFLSNEGHIYSTIDEDHYRCTD